MYNDTCSLIPIVRTVNSMGDTIETEGTAKTVFCRAKSYSLKEKFMAGTDGDIPELTIVLEDKLEYGQEPYILYNGVKYKVIHVAFNDLSNDIGLVVGKWQP